MRIYNDDDARGIGHYSDAHCDDDGDNIDDDCDCPQFPLWLRSTSSIVLISLLQ